MIGGTGKRSDQRGTEVAVELTSHLVNVHPRGRSMRTGHRPRIHTTNMPPQSPQQAVGDDAVR